MTSTIGIRPPHRVQRGLSTTGALLLTIAGNILVTVIAAVGIAGVAAAALLVFGPGLFAAL